jgi:hypothetical protein
MSGNQPNSVVRCLPNGLILGTQFRVEGLINREKHADVYKIVTLTGYNDVDQVEARAIDLRNLPPALCRHRKRCLKRLKQRSIMQTEIQGLQVIVYQTGGLPRAKQNAEKSSGSSLSGLSDAGDKNANSQLKDGKIKSAYERESARLRQRDRRIAKRQWIRTEKEEKGHQGICAERGGSSDIDEDSFAVLKLL